MQRTTIECEDIYVSCRRENEFFGLMKEIRRSVDNDGRCRLRAERAAEVCQRHLRSLFHHLPDKPSAGSHHGLHGGIEQRAPKITWAAHHGDLYETAER
jgi:hypothetical protein